MTINTIGIVMQQMNANMQMSFRSTEGDNKVLDPCKRYSKEPFKWLEKLRAQSRAAQQLKSQPKSQYQLRYEAILEKRETERRRKEEEKIEKRIKKTHDAVYGYLFNLDIQEDKDIKAMAKEIIEYLNWSYNSYYVYDQASLKVDVEDIDYGRRRYFEKVSLEVIHRKRNEKFELVIELKKFDLPEHKIHVGWDYAKKRCYYSQEGKMKGKFVEYVIDWAIDLLNELTKLELEGEIEKKRKKSINEIRCF